VIAYSAHKSGRLVIMDGKGARQEIDGTKDVVFPAWSPDGTRLAWLEKDGRKKYVLKTAKVE
jgi:Tol biopolymer transport system component